MSNITELSKKARELKSKGLSTGEISDELNVSRETALWFLTHKIDEESEPAVKDIYVNWRSSGSSPQRVKFLSYALTDLIVQTLEENELDDPDVVVGVANSGTPIATLVALELGADIAFVVPTKHLWDPDKPEEEGYLLSNFSDVKNKSSVLIDDVITTGTTIKETLKLLRKLGSQTLMAAVLLDKAGVKSIESVPIESLFSASVV